jgi:hypothetical protein
LFFEKYAEKFEQQEYQTLRARLPRQETAPWLSAILISDFFTVPTTAEKN